jgi:hypothetical protein
LASKYLKPDGSPMKTDYVDSHHSQAQHEEGPFNLQPLQDALQSSDDFVAPQASLDQQLSQGQMIAEVVALQTVIPCIEEALTKSQDGTSLSQQD